MYNHEKIVALFKFSNGINLFLYFRFINKQTKKMSDLKTPQDNRLGDDAAYADGGAEPKNVQVGRYS